MEWNRDDLHGRTHLAPRSSAADKLVWDATMDVSGPFLEGDLRGLPGGMTAICDQTPSYSVNKDANLVVSTKPRQQKSSKFFENKD